MPIHLYSKLSNMSKGSDSEDSVVFLMRLERDYLLFSLFFSCAIYFIILSCVGEKKDGNVGEKHDISGIGTVGPQKIRGTGKLVADPENVVYSAEHSNRKKTATVAAIDGMGSAVGNFFYFLIP